MRRGSRRRARECRGTALPVHWTCCRCATRKTPRGRAPAALAFTWEGWRIGNIGSGERIGCRRIAGGVELSSEIALTEYKTGDETAGSREGVPREHLLAPPLGKPERLLSLDVFRGLTIAGMIIVNNPGSWGTLYAPLGHAAWDGWTPTDFVFPFFLFIVGVAMTFSFDRRLAQGAGRVGLIGHVAARAAVLFLLGMILAGFPNFRLIMPWILAITGILLLEKGLSAGGRPKMRAGGYALLAAALVWVGADFRYLGSPAPRGGFEDLFPLATGGGGSLIRIPGVLQRIALCYAAAALVMMSAGVLGRAACALGLINGYWLLMKYIAAPAGYVIGGGAEGTRVDAPPGAPFTGALNDWLDVQVLGNHLYGSRPDPEGILSTLPAVATTLLGVLAGMWIRREDQSRRARAAGLFVAGNLLIVLGACMDGYFPINKKIWSSSFVVFMAGWAMAVLSACYYAIDVKGWRRWSLPFLVLGTNAILAFFGAGIGARLLNMVRWGEGEGAVTLRAWLYQLYQQALTEPKNASLAWAISYAALWVLLITPLYRRRIFLKV